MVADQQCRPLLGYVCSAGNLQPIDGVHQHPVDEAQQKFRYQCIDVERDRRVEHSGQQQQLRNRHSGIERHHCEPGRHHHEQRVQDIVCGNHPRTMAWRATRLDQRVQRHDIKAAEHADHEQVQNNPPGTRLHQKLPCAYVRVRNAAGRGKEQIHGEHAQADGSERHQSDFHLVSGQAFAQQRARCHTD